jgi:hypothetical protein
MLYCIVLHCVSHTACGKPVFVLNTCVGVSNSRTHPFLLCFGTCRPLDVFFVLLLGPYCLVSSTSHSTQHHHWGWHLKLPVAQPDDVLTLVSLAGRGDGLQLYLTGVALRGMGCAS